MSGILLRETRSSRENVAHIPVDVAHARLDAQELAAVLPPVAGA